MSNTVQKSDQTEPVTTEGLEELFDSALVPVDANECQEPISTSAELVPVEVAAPLLDTSINALKKQLRKGKCKGIKRPFKHGEKWFVYSTELPNKPISKDAESATDDDEPVLIDTNECQEPVLTDADECQEPVSAYAEPVPVESSEHFQMIRELQSKLEALTYRNGYLESKLEDRENEIKLLTDRQSLPTNWQRFKKWFMGG